ncbi:hypothetical protein [Granulicella arctica]|uniref:hypothetical protein n=1 Tax=Granulicella arctica TaxID=940613 RepID=UPI0021E0D9B8|nr:hypothetical protein [Granulicella arctica]
MADGVQDGPQVVDGSSGIVPAAQVAQLTPAAQAPNGIRYANYGQNNLAAGELERIVQAVPATVAAALNSKVYYFVPLALSGSAEGREHRGGTEETMIATAYTPELGDQAICHRNVPIGSDDGVFISTRLLNDRFALAFEFFINVGHAFVETAGVPEAFNKLVWDQALKDVRGETSQDAWESRSQSLVKPHMGPLTGDNTTTRPSVDEKAKSEYLEAAFADAVAIYQLSLSVDFNYSELREREYPLLAPQPLAERLRLAARLFPPNPGYEFAIRYRRRA